MSGEVKVSDKGKGEKREIQMDRYNGKEAALCEMSYIAGEGTYSQHHQHLGEKGGEGVEQGGELKGVD